MSIGDSPMYDRTLYRLGEQWEQSNLRTENCAFSSSIKVAIRISSASSLSCHKQLTNKYNSNFIELVLMTPIAVKTWTRHSDNQLTRKSPRQSCRNRGRTCSAPPSARWLSYRHRTRHPSQCQNPPLPLHPPLHLHIRTHIRKCIHIKPSLYHI